MHTLAKTLLALTLTAWLFLPTGDANAHGGRGFCGPTQKVCLEVCHPKTGCRFTVDACIPCCCVGAPCVSHQRCLLGPGNTVFSWACGYEVVVHHKICGGYRISYRD